MRLLAATWRQPRWQSAGGAQLHSCQRTAISAGKAWIFTGGWQPVASSENGCDIKSIVVGLKAHEKREDFVGYLADQKLRRDGVDVADFSTFDVSGTPTLAPELVTPG